MELSKISYIGEKIKNAKEIKMTKLLKIEILVTVISIILGTLLHFTYQWSNGNLFVASFSAVNESVWEHLKLIFFPMLIVGIIEYFFVKNITKNYLEAKTIGIFIAICFVVISFFTYTGIIGTNAFIIDILIFIISIVLGEYIAYKLMKRKNESDIKTLVLSGIILLFLFSCFVLCTYFPPKVNLFRDSVTNSYGINDK